MNQQFPEMTIGGVRHIAFPVEDVLRLLSAIQEQFADATTLPAVATPPLCQPVAPAAPTPAAGAKGPRTSSAAPRFKRFVEGAAATKDPKGPAPQAGSFAEVVLRAIRVLGEADIALIVATLEKAAEPQLGPDPARQVSNALYAVLSTRGQIEKVDDKRGWWRVKP